MTEMGDMLEEYIKNSELEVTSKDQHSWLKPQGGKVANIEKKKTPVTSLDLLTWKEGVRGSKDTRKETSWKIKA